MGRQAAGAVGRGFGVVPVLLMTIAYARIINLHVDLGWAAMALGLALLCLLAAERVERYREARGLGDALGFMPPGSVGVSQPGSDDEPARGMADRRAVDPVPLLAWIHRRIAVRSIRWLAAVVAGAVLVRLVLNYNLLEYPLGTTPLFSWVIYGYGIPAISFFAAASYFRKNVSGLLITLLEAGALAFLVLLVSFEIRLVIAGRLDAPHYTLLEQSLQSISWLAVGSVLAMRKVSSPSRVAFSAPGFCWAARRRRSFCCNC